ncbi:MAG: hypothetical protein WD058_04145 [Dehalococcoidia bacterium]
MTAVVHVISATLRPDAPADAVRAAIERGRALEAAPGARRVVIARAPADDAQPGAILVATWLDDRAALEPFAASPEHMAFVMRGLAPCIAGMWSAAVEAESEPPAADDLAGFGALWVFAVRASDTAFEWQVRDVLHSLDDLPALVAAGPTFEERDRYRAGGVACVAAGDIEAFRGALDAARGRWGEIALQVVDTLGTTVI